MRKNLVKIGHIFRAICSRTDRHTRSSQYSAAHTGVTSGQMSGHWVSYGQTRGSDESLVERASLSYTQRADAGHRTDPCNPFTVINHICSGRNCTRPAWKTLTSERQFLYSFLRHFPVRVRHNNVIMYVGLLGHSAVVVHVFLKCFTDCLCGCVFSVTFY